MTQLYPHSRNLFPYFSFILESSAVKLLSLRSYMTLGMLLNLSLPQFPYWKNEDIIVPAS